MLTKDLKKELYELVVLGSKILYVSAEEKGALITSSETENMVSEYKKEIPYFKKSFQTWYTRAYRCVRVLAPERLGEFETLYTGQKNPKTLSYLTAGMTHFLQDIVTTTSFGETRDYYGKFSSGLQLQINIINSILENFDNIVFNIQSEIRFDIYRSEIAVATDLKKQKQYRAAGAIIGVVIEDHLKSVCLLHNIKIRKKNPTISDYNEALKAKDMVDLVMWRLITRCSDIRNYCVHSKEREPKIDEIEDIIRAAEKVTSEVA